MSIIATTVYRTIQGIRKEPVFEKLKWLESTQWWSRDKIEQMQLTQLRQILLHAFHTIPYYQKTFAPYANLLDNLQSVSQLSQLPFLTKAQIRENFTLLRNPSFEGRIQIESTSGSTGDPMQFIHDRSAGAFARAISYREHNWYDINIGDKEARFYGIPMDHYAKFRERIKDILMNRRRFCVFNLSDDALGNYYSNINHYKPKYIYGYTSAVFELIHFMKRNNLKFKGDFIKAVIVTSEVLMKEHRDIMESYLEVPVVNEYGCSEVGIIAAECPHHGLHISAENVIVEIINKKVHWLT